MSSLMTKDTASILAFIMADSARLETHSTAVDSEPSSNRSSPQVMRDV